MEKINQFRIFNKLKSVYRANSVDARKESSAEHSWSCLILADFFLSQMNHDLDRLKIYELLMYHDVVEIEAGDTPAFPPSNPKDKKEREKKAAALLEKKFPSPLNGKFKKLFDEFEDRTTPEAKFAKAVDVLDAHIHELDYEKDWRGWTKEFILRKAHIFEDFPELREALDSVLDYLSKNKYFNL